VLVINPKHADTHCNLGNVLKDKGDLGGAIACYQKALAINPKLVRAHLALGNTLQAKGELGGAIACYQKALAINPMEADGQGRRRRGHGLLQEGPEL
jgi:tetratricopeptide (TPR) repeat protein